MKAHTLSVLTLNRQVDHTGMHSYIKMISRSHTPSVFRFIAVLSYARQKTFALSTFDVVIHSTGVSRLMALGRFIRNKKIRHIIEVAQL